MRSGDFFAYFFVTEKKKVWLAAGET